MKMMVTCLRLFNQVGDLNNELHSEFEVTDQKSTADKCNDDSYRALDVSIM